MVQVLGDVIMLEKGVNMVQVLGAGIIHIGLMGVVYHIHYDNILVSLIFIV